LRPFRHAAARLTTSPTTDTQHTTDHAAALIGAPPHRSAFPDRPTTPHSWGSSAPTDREGDGLNLEHLKHRDIVGDDVQHPDTAGFIDHHQTMAARQDAAHV
jgi:hypothetical protein